MSHSTSYDAIVIGGGPAGATAATLIARDGYRVLLLERNLSMPFKVGESLIPATYETLDRLGMLDKLAAGRFPEKHSVQFFSGDGRASAPFYFRETAGDDEPPDRSRTWQVLRSEFDTLLLDNAREKGVEVELGASVREVLFDDEGRATGVRVRREETAGAGPGETVELHSRVLVDAGGQSSILARRFGLRRHDPHLRMAAIYTHFEGGVRDAGIDEGATLILKTRGNRAWFWYIPLPDDRVSVGVVGPVDHLVRGREGGPQQIFDEELAECPGLQPRLTSARQLWSPRVVKDFSYISEKVAGDGWILAGDAFGFLDPIYSSGVFLALRSGELAADATTVALAAGDPSEDRLRRFEPELRAAMAAFRRLIYAFYDPEFNFAKFLRRHPYHRSAIVDILVGDVFGRSFAELFEDLAPWVSLPEESATSPSAGPILDGTLPESSIAVP